jgi:hypothetical protein
MARPILALLLLSLPLAAAQNCASAKGDALTLQQQTKTGPFYKALVTQAGAPLSCRLDVEEDKITITYAFHGNMELRTLVDPSVESSEQRLTTRMPMDKAITLLKAAEQDAYKPGGCGIAWDHPESKDGVTVYSGTTCNCQARVTTRGTYAVTLMLKSAC